MSAAKHVKHFLSVRPYLLIAVCLMTITFVLSAGLPTVATRLFLSWNIGVWFYLTALWTSMLRADSDRIEHIADIQINSAIIILMLTCTAAVVSLLVVLTELPQIKALTGDARLIHIFLTALTLTGTWLLIPTVFAMTYAHAFYIHTRKHAPPLQFPDNPSKPLYSDFLYFSFTIAVASQTADVTIASQRLRKLVLIQSVLAFLFNTTLIGLTINLVSGLIG